MPFRPIPDDAPALIRALDRIAEEHLLERKVVIAAARGAGRELLRTLARMRGGWTGFIVETPRPLALHIATHALAERGLRVMDEFEEEALVDEALDAVVAEGAPGAAFGPLAGGRGFRRAARGAVQGLRLAGVSPERIRAARLSGEDKRALLGALLREVEREMGARGVADAATVLRLATEALRAGEPLPADRVYLLPGLSRRGMSGRFVEALIARGAEILPTDPVKGRDEPPGLVWRAAGAPERRPAATEGLPLFDGPVSAQAVAAPLDSTRPRPDLHLFRAAGVHEELREVLRRVLASGRPWDDIEIVTPDPAVYGPTLHGLATHLGVGVTFAVGLPVERTRPGRAVAAYLRWIEDDFPSPVLRRLLENDDLRAPGRHRDVNPRWLAHRLRELRVGWGRDRYAQLVDAALERLEREPPRPRPDDTPDAVAERTERTRAELEALKALTTALLRATPREVPRRLELNPRPVSPARLAAGVGALLRLVPTRRGSVDETAKERLSRVLDRIRHTLTREAPFHAALGSVLDHLEIRVPAPRAEGKAPWLSDGGSVHLTDLEHGGLSGRPLTFIVGLDASRFPGGDAQDPLLLDGERAALSSDLPTSRDRATELRFRFDALLARLRGTVVMSYPAWEATEGRVQSPSPVLLEAYRASTGDADLGFEELRDHLGMPASRIPRGGTCLDREDVWLHALARGDHLLEGAHVVREAFPRLDAGLRARGAWTAPTPGPFNGVLAPRSAFDPRGDPEAVVSASRLEALAACPLRYFYRYVLHVKPPDDPEYRPDEWLNSLRRGSLLHRVYERTLRLAREEGVEPGEEAFAETAQRVLGEEALHIRAEVPPPSEAVYEREMDALREDARLFGRHLLEHPAPWTRLERRFGFGDDGEPPPEIALPGGPLRVRGAIDRVDRIEREPGGPELLRIIDYKTGRFARHWSNATGIYSGGRRLQHVLYSLTLEALEGRAVESMEYHFPTRKGEGRVKRFLRSELAGGPALLARLLDGAARGHFVPTESADDCRFCDFREICRVTEGGWGGTSSPPADWGRERMAEGSEAYLELTGVRCCEEEPS